MNGSQPSSRAVFPLSEISHIFIDCDDCLYQNNWSTAKKITASIAAFTQDKLGVSREQAYAYYKQYGTCLKGLLVEGIIDEAGVEEFLREVHDIDYGDIAKDEELRRVLGPLAASKPTWIFTASAREHAQRCLAAVGLDELPWRGIIDTRDCKLETKHSASSFDAAMSVAGATEASRCLFADDSKKNVVAAKRKGWRTVLVGFIDRDSGARVETPPEADAHVAKLSDIGALLGVAGPQRLDTTWIHLGLGATALREPPFTNGLDWYDAYARRRESDGADGRLVSMFTFHQSWDSWEVHPEGAEVVLCTAGELTLLQDLQGDILRITLRAGEFAVNDPGVWHTADVDDHATCVFITAGKGTQHKPR